MAVGSLRARVLDDSVVTLNFPQPVSNSNFSSFIEILMPDAVRELAAGDLTFGRWVAAELGVQDFDQEYELGTGTLVIGSAISTGLTQSSEWLQRIAIWEGSGFSLKTTQIGGDPTALITFLEQLDIVEDSDGISALPKLADLQVNRLGWHGPQFAITLSEFGILHARELTPDLASDLPNVEGFPAAGGDLYVIVGERQNVLILVGQGSFTKLYPADSLTESEALAFALKLVVQWEPSTSGVQGSLSLAPRGMPA